LSISTTPPPPLPFSQTAKTLKEISELKTRQYWDASIVARINLLSGPLDLCSCFVLNYIEAHTQRAPR
jgi:hypothetical protein